MLRVSDSDSTAQEQSALQEGRVQCNTLVFQRAQKVGVNVPHIWPLEKRCRRLSLSGLSCGSILHGLADF